LSIYCNQIRILWQNSKLWIIEFEHLSQRLTVNFLKPLIRALERYQGNVNNHTFHGF
jgi:hypothetical protein